MQYFRIYILISLWFISFSASSEEIVLLGNGVDDEYNKGALTLALDETIESHGSYTISVTDTMSDSRAERTLITKKYKNAVRIGIPGMTLIDLDYVQFPVQLGGLGFQVCFKSKNNKRLLSEINSIEDIKAFSFAAPKNWADDDIYLENGFKVEPGFDSSLKRTILHLFQMANDQQVDYACRPITTIENEMKEFPIAQTLEMEKRFALWLEKPLFFGTINNKALVERLQTGFDKAWKKGSYKTFWESHYLASFIFSHIADKKIFYLPSPAIPADRKQYQQYLYFTPTL